MNFFDRLLCAVGSLIVLFSVNFEAIYVTVFLAREKNQTISFDPDIAILGLALFLMGRSTFFSEFAIFLFPSLQKRPPAARTPPGAPPPRFKTKAEYDDWKAKEPGS